MVQFPHIHLGEKQTNESIFHFHFIFARIYICRTDNIEEKRKKKKNGKKMNYDNFL